MAAKVGRWGTVQTVHATSPPAKLQCSIQFLAQEKIRGAEKEVKVPRTGAALQPPKTKQESRSLGLGFRVLGLGFLRKGMPFKLLTTPSNFQRLSFGQTAKRPQSSLCFAMVIFLSGDVSSSVTSPGRASGFLARCELYQQQEQVFLQWIESRWHRPQEVV